MRFNMSTTGVCDWDPTTMSRRISFLAFTWGRTEINRTSWGTTSARSAKILVQLMPFRYSSVLIKTTRSSTSAFSGRTSAASRRVCSAVMVRSRFSIVSIAVRVSAACPRSITASETSSTSSEYTATLLENMPSKPVSKDANSQVGRPLGPAEDRERPQFAKQPPILHEQSKVGNGVEAAPVDPDQPPFCIDDGDVVQAGIESTPRVAGVQSGRPQVEDGRSLPVEGVIWATGFRPDYDWIDLPVFDERGYPRHQRGIVREAPGLYFVGLHWLHKRKSALFVGVGEDADHVVERLVEHRASGKEARA